MERRLGPYTLLRQIAVGGMAEIYLASASDREGREHRVALKLIHPHYAGDPEISKMLVDEARLAVQLDHENIVRTYDLGSASEQHYIVMELVDGIDLFSLLRAAAERDVDIPIEAAAHIAREVSSALDYAHRKRDGRGRPLQIVHRDVSPQNILISFAGATKLVDFGIAKAAHRAALTQAGIIKGKYHYMSPEQAWGDPVDARTDIFSTGIVLYEMLVGQTLYLEEDLDRLIDMVRRAEIPPPSSRRRDVPRDLEQIVMRALRKRPTDRWPTAADLSQALTDFLRGYAPGFTPRELGAFVRSTSRRARPEGDEDSAPLSRRSIDELTAPRARPFHAFETRSALGVEDDNSLLFRTRSASRPPVPRPASRETELLIRKRPADETAIDEPPAVRSAPPGSHGSGSRSRPLLSRLDEDESDRSPTTLTDGAHAETQVARPAFRPVPAETAAAGKAAAEPERPPGGKHETPLSADDSTRVSGAFVPPPPGGETLPPPPPPMYDPVSHPPVQVPDVWFGRSSPLPLVLAFLAATAVGALGVSAVMLWPGGAQPAQVEISSLPQGASVVIDGRTISTPTPVRIIDLDASTPHRIVLRRQGFKSWETELRFDKAGQRRLIQAILLPSGRAPAGGQESPAD